MEQFVVVKENWLTRDPTPGAMTLTVFMVMLLVLSNVLFLSGAFHLDNGMAASKDSIFNQHQYWRAWTALIAHRDWGHLLSNLFLFAPFCYYLYGYFGPWYFPVTGFVIGGLTNITVVNSMPAQVSLVGVSGVVYWMGAAWLTLYLLIERRESIRRRLFKVFIISAVLFLPETYRPEISYYSHFLGFAAGVVSSLVHFAINRKKILAAVVTETIFEV
ncbi:MAG: rhomboid family intramembrane serine protease [Bdellovibrio sp.]